MKGIIIQARLGSSRLPRKILRPFYKDKSILELLIEKIQSINKKGLKIIVATSESQDNNPIEEIAKKYEINCYRGSENDVLDRFIQAAKKYSISEIIRVCSDNPFLELRAMRDLIRYVDSLPLKKDYVSFCVSNIPSIKTHYGFWTEYVTLDALERISRHTNEPIYHEHVTNYIYTHKDKFSIGWINTEGLRSDIRLTIDTEADFENAQSIYRDLCSLNPYPEIAEVVEYLDNHPIYYQKMKEQIIKNSK